MDRLRARGAQRDSTGVLAVLGRRRHAAADLRALPQGPGIHRRPGARLVHLRAQSLFHPPRAPRRHHRGAVISATLDAIAWMEYRAAIRGAGLSREGAALA